MSPSKGQPARTVSVLALLAITLAGCSANQAQDRASTARAVMAPLGGWPAERAAGRLPLEICEREGIEEPLLCGTLQVPLDRSEPGGPSLGIRVVVVPAAGEPSESALAEHQGGPGFTMLGVARLFADGGELERFRARRDVILFDQRGVGESAAVYCDALRPNPILRQRFPPDLVHSCREQLRGEVELSHYSTSEAVDDLEAIRQWLGYEQLDLVGWSYGSRFMRTYMQRYPNRVRTLTVGVPTPIDYRRPIDWARFGEAAYDGLAASCAEDAKCAAAIPDPKGDLLRLAERVESEPIETQLTHPETGERLTARIDRQVLSELLWTTMLSTQDARRLLWWVHRAAQGDPEPLLKNNIPDEPGGLWSEPTYLSVVCPEEVAHIQPEEIDAAVAGTVIGRDFVDSWIETCRLWDLPPAPGTPTEPVELMNPALIVTGGLDPVALPEYGDRIASHLPRSLHVTIPLRGHNGGGMTHQECLNDLIFDFVEQGSVAELDPSCLATMQPPPFQAGPEITE